MKALSCGEDGRVPLLRACCGLAAALVCALLAGPAAYAQNAPPAQDAPAASMQEETRPWALPASPRTFLLNDRALRQEAAATSAARRAARQAARLGPRTTPPAASQPASEGAAPNRRRGPTGNARSPAWNLPLRSGDRFTVYANTAIGQIDAQYDDDGDRVTLANEIPLERRDLVAIAGLLGLDEETAAVAQDQFNISTDVRIPGRIEGTVNTVNLNLGAIYNFYSNPFFDVGFGLDFQAAQQNFTADRVLLDTENARGDLDLPPFLEDAGVTDVQNGTVSQIADRFRQVAGILPGLGLTVPEEIPGEIEVEDDREIEGSFQAQALTLFLQAQNPFLNLRGGFQLDLGQDPDLADGEREVSDRQNAILLGATASYPATERLRVHGGVDGWLTLENEENGITYDEGDSYAAQVGADFKVIPSLALGAALTYRYRTEASLDVGNTEPIEPVEASGYHLGVAPYVNYMPEGLPLTLYLKGGVRDEYREFSFSLIGENEFAPRAGFTFGAVYHF